MGSTKWSVQDIHDLACSCLLANGCDEANANAVATFVTDAERDACAGHGLIRLPGYVAALRSGKVDGKAAPKIENPIGGILRVDANGGFAPLAFIESRTALLELAARQGVAMAAMVRMHHFAALWIEVEALARKGVVALACTSYMPAMPPAGGNKPFFGTNPIAFGWPRGQKDPLVFDMATASKARGELMVAARDGHAVPDGTGLDNQGNPTTDAAAILEGGMVLPFGGYKGASIAMMVELLAAGVTGERFSYEAAEADNKDGGPPRGGEFILAIDPAVCGGSDWLEHGEAFFERLLSIDGTRLPSARRYLARQMAGANGVEVPDDLIDKIRQLVRA